MQIILITAIALGIWLTIGYLFWRTIYYGSIKFFYLMYDDPCYKHSKANISWLKSRPMVICCGIVNIIAIMFFPVMREVAYKYGITLYFNPQDEAKQ